MTVALVLGAAGFLGSHLSERLVGEGWEVRGLDSLISGSIENLAGLKHEPLFSFEISDITESIEMSGEIDWVFNLASPASPKDYYDLPIQTLEAGALGTLSALRFAQQKAAFFFQASTSEVYGDPLEHPQAESYWGNVNPVGPRSVYDESKRFGEAATMAFHRAHGLPIRIVRIFNTYGPRMRVNDGRAVPAFIHQAMNGLPVSVHGSGSQTRSLCYVHDLIEGFWRLAVSDLTFPVNLGNPEEIAIIDLARLIIELTGSPSELEFVDRPKDDPEVRRPDISLALRHLGWEPSVSLREGLAATIAWARQRSTARAREGT
jgi:nucleoside-diphosphate-sugar epimerase